MSLSGLPADLQLAARIDANGEVSWPDDYAASAIEALTEAGHRVLGLDVRFYFGDGTLYEFPWSSSEADGLQAKADALDALSHIDELERPAHVERRVLVTSD
jgi:FAD/FMN-containing dehydrogenase